MQPGVQFRMVSYFGKPCDNPRTVARVQSNAIACLKSYTKDYANAKRGDCSWLEFPSAAQISFTEKGFSTHAIGTRELKPEEKRIMDARPRDEKQERIDILSDGSTMYYREKRYYAESDAPWLGCLSDYVAGKRITWNGRTLMEGALVIDKSIKGQVELEYEYKE